MELWLAVVTGYQALLPLARRAEQSPMNIGYCFHGVERMHGCQFEALGSSNHP